MNHETGVDQPSDGFEGVVPHDGGCGVEVEPAREHAERVEHRAGVVVEELDAPVDRAGEGALPLRTVGARGGQHVDALAEPFAQLRRREQAGACRRQLDRERQSVERTADGADVGEVASVERPATGGERAVEEESFGRTDGGGIHPVAARRERSDLETTLAGGPEGDSARCEYDGTGCGDEQPGDLRRRFEQVLDVVDDEERGPVADGRRDAVLEAAVADVDDAERRRDRRDHERRVVERREIDEAHARRVRVGNAGRRRHREPGLAHSAGPGQRDESIAPLTKQGLEEIEIVLSADEGVERSGERVAGRGRIGGVCPVEPFADHQGEVMGHERTQLLGVAERRVGDVVVFPDAVDECVEAFLARTVRGAEVHESRLALGELVLALEAGGLLARRDPAVARSVDADEDVALREIGPVEVPRGMRA